MQTMRLTYEIMGSRGSSPRVEVVDGVFEVRLEGWAATPPLIEVHVVIFTTSPNRHKSRSPHVLVAIFTTSLNHHKYMWRFSPQVQITTSTCGDIVHGWVKGQGAQHKWGKYVR